MTYVAPEDMTQAEAVAFLDQMKQDSIEVKAYQLEQRLLHADAIEHLDPPEPLIEGVLYRDSLAELFGKPGCGKSFVALDWACHVATGKDWQGHQTRRGTVLYIVGEGAGGMGKRRKAWRTAWKLDPLDLVFLRDPVPLLDVEWVQALGRLADLGRFDLIVIDTLSRSIAGHNENAPETMSSLVANADWLRNAARGACLLFVHHSTKDGQTNRGHSALEGACDVRWKVSKDSETIRLANEKTKDEAQHPDVDLALKVIDLGTDASGRHLTSAVVESHSVLGWAGELTNSETALLDLARDSFGTTGATASQLREVSGQPRTTFYRALNTLVRDGLLTNKGTDKRPHYYVTETSE